MRPMTGRAVADILSELDLYSLIRTRVVSKGRYGRTREIILDLPSELVDSIHDTIRMSFDVER